MSGAAVTLPTLHGQQCTGSPSSRRRRHKKPFIGIADVGQLTFCEIQSTISQMAMQPEYVEAAFADDRTSGINVVSHPEMAPDERREAERRLKILAQGGLDDPLLRRLAGNVAESIELGGLASDRRHFDFGKFYVIGLPDGLSAMSAIEFSTSRYPQLAVGGKRIQGNLYAVLWERSSVQIVLVSSDSGRRIEEQVPPDSSLAERWLSHAWELLSGASPPKPPARATRCKSCPYNERRGCSFPRVGTVPTFNEMQIIAQRFGS